MICAFVLERFAAFLGDSRSPPVTPDSDIDGDRHAHHHQGAESQDDEPPSHPHDSLGYQKVVVDTDPTPSLLYFDVPVADFFDSWNAATLLLSIKTDPVSTNAGTGAKLSLAQSESRCPGLLWYRSSSACNPTKAME